MLRHGAERHPEFAEFLKRHVEAIEAAWQRPLPDLQAAEEMAARAQWDVFKAGVAPLDTGTAFYRLGVNKEVTAENVATTALSVLPVGAAAGKIAGKVGGRAVGAIGEEVADSASDPTAKALDEGSPSGEAHAAINLSLTHHPKWTSAQREAAEAKVKILNDSPTVAAKTARSTTSASARYRRSGKTIPPGSDVDHKVDLQLGGTDTLSNMRTLDSSVNRSLGAQIRHRIKNLPHGTPVNKVRIKER